MTEEQKLKWRNYDNSPKRKEYKRQWKRKNKFKDEYASMKRHPDRVRARWIVGNALKRGEISRSKCKKCGAKEVEAHHKDYTKPLVITWLCRPCHGLEHRKLGLSLSRI